MFSSTRFPRSLSSLSKQACLIERFGGNDVLSVLNPDGTVNLPAIYPILQNYGQNLAAILGTLASMPDAKIYVGNLYDPKLPVAGSDLLIQGMNQVTAEVVQSFPGRVVLVDLYAAFQGRSGLLLVEKHGAAPDQIHPTDSGYGVMARAFADAISRK